MDSTRFVCNNCGYVTHKWLGKCPSCNMWDSFSEEIPVEPAVSTTFGISRNSSPLSIQDIQIGPEKRFPSGISELDRALGGGFVKGQVILLGGEPGIGKSTLMLQLCSILARKGHKTIYISSEESATQIKIRSIRIDSNLPNIYILNESNIELIEKHISSLKPDAVILDSIQTVYTSKINSIPGTISQVRDCAMRLVGVAKQYEMLLFLIAHITKTGVIAGPKVLEHIVDTVIYFEGDMNQTYRVIRPIKNRFGPVEEIGIFSMTEKGLIPVSPESIPCPSSALDSSPKDGTILTVAVEGKRIFPAELQALVAPAVYGVPERKGVGIDHRKLAIIIAILEKRIGVKLQNQDVFVNVFGGIKVSDPALDTGFLTVIYSSLCNKPIPAGVSILGEISLNGDIRPVSHIDLRIKELRRRGIDTVLIPDQRLQREELEKYTIRIHNVKDALQKVF